MSQPGLFPVKGTLFFIVNGGEIEAYSLHIGNYLIERQKIGEEEIFKVYSVDENKRKEIFYKNSDMLLEVKALPKKFIKRLKNLFLRSVDFQMSNDSSLNSIYTNPLKIPKMVF